MYSKKKQIRWCTCTWLSSPHNWESRSNQSLQWFTSEVVLATKLTGGYLVPTEPGWPSYGPEKFLGDMLSLRLFPVGPIVGVSRWLWFCTYDQQNSLWALLCTSVPISAGFWMWTRYQSMPQEERLIVPRRQAIYVKPPGPSCLCNSNVRPKWYHLKAYIVFSYMRRKCLDSSSNMG